MNVPADPISDDALVARGQRIDDAVRWSLALGLAVGVALIFTGGLLVVVGHGLLPRHVDGFGAVWTAVGAGRAEGFFDLGLLVIVLTPFIRVIGSLVMFAVERDWRFVAVTATVLAIMVLTVGIGVS